MADAARDPPRIGHNAQVRVVIARALADLFPGSSQDLQIDAETVDELVSKLDRRWPGMRDRIVDSSPAIRRHLNVFVDGRKARLATPIPKGSTVYILTAMSGG